MSDDNQEMEHMEFLRAQFFAPANEQPSRPTPKRKSRKMPPDIRALKQFVRTMEHVDPNDRRAAIYWLADAYLGIKLWDRR